MQQSKAPSEGTMINSFLNLCRVCPVPTDDKVNSEYKRNFTWHNGYQAAKVDVVRNAPSMPSAEPSLPRKKKYPGQPARDHPLYDEGGESSDSLELSSQLGLASQDPDSRARIPDEDTRPASKMQDEADSTKTESTKPRGNPGTPGPPEEGTVTKTTEYRSQFVAYPRAPGESPTTRKSASMGLIGTPPLRTDVTDGVDGGELRNGLSIEDDDDAALDAFKRGRIKKTEYKSKFRPFSAYTYVDGGWKKATRLIKDRDIDDMEIYSSYSYPLLSGPFIDNETSSEADQHAWYSEVMERLKKADQYKSRSHVGAQVYGIKDLPPEFFIRDRTILSPVSVASSSRTWKDDRPAKERGRPGPVPVHHRKEKKDASDSLEFPKSSKKKSQVEKTTVRPKSAEPVIPVKSEHRSPKRTRPRAPKDLPVHGHGDLSGRKKAYKLSMEKSSPLGMKARSVHRPRGGEEAKVWLKPETSKEGEEDDQKKEVMVNGFGSEETGKMVNGEGPDDYAVQQNMNGEHTAVSMLRGPVKVPLTSVKSPEEVTGVRSPDPESWTVPLEIGKGLHWMDGRTPDGVQKGPPILLSKRLKESSLVGKSQKDIVLCDPGSDATGDDVVDL